MRLRARILGGFAIAAAAIFVLPGCHKPKSGETANAPAPAGPASVRSLLDYNAAQTARIVAASSDRPAKLDRLIVAQGQPYPNFLWTIGLRTSQPFECVTGAATQARCYAVLSWVGSDRIAGYADVMMYDHDVTIADLLADRDFSEPAGLGQTVRTTTVSMYKSGPNSGANGPSTTCRQAQGATANGPTSCFSLIGPRTVLWGWLEADTPSFDADGAQAMSVKPNFIVAAMEKMIRQLRMAAFKPDGSFSIHGNGVVGPEMDFSDPGWYASNPGFIFKDSLYAGPYNDEQSCQADLTRASTAYAQFIREANTIEHCAYYANEPDGL